MRSSIIGVLLILGLAYVAFAVPALVHFYSYCRKVAESTGRSNENQSTHTNEDGTNAFEREQFRKLRSGEYANLEDPALVAQGHVLARKMRLAQWLAVGLVVCVAAAVFWPQ
jgi:hypothetical protein